MLRTEYAQELLKAFDKGAMEQIVHALSKRADWVRSEAEHVNATVSRGDAADLYIDASNLRHVADAMASIFGEG